MTKWRRNGMGFGLIAAVAAGCGQPAGPGTAAKPTESGKAVAKAEKPAGKEKEGHAGGGWWCNEHGVPEHDCALCNDKVAAEYKAKGDWCKEYDRPESQCFLCGPKRAEKFAAQYRAKFDKDPPPPAPENVKGGATDGDKK
jgi:hypothetical protein